MSEMVGPMLRVSILTYGELYVVQWNCFPKERGHMFRLAKEYVRYMHLEFYKKA
jgi:hypothetical protein